MAKNYVQDGDVVTITAPAGAVSGAPALYGAMFGIFGNTAAEGNPVPFHRAGIWSLAKDNAAIGAGAKVYFVSGTGKVSATAEGNTFIGYARDAAGAGDAAANVVLAGA